jgi:hypothetical protein
MAEDAGDAEAEAHGDIRPDRTERVAADEADQDADPQRPEDQSDEAAEKTDRGAGEDGRCWV